MITQCVTINILSTGSLSITSTPPGASIFIGGILQTGNTPNTITGIAEGSHDITIRMNGFNDYTTTILVIADTNVTMDNVLLIPNEGCIYFNTNPPGASIYTDGTLREGRTPSLICGLSLGHHTYRLYLEGYLNISGGIDLISGHGETISQDFVQIVEAGFNTKERFLIVGLLFGFAYKAIDKWNKMRTEKIR